MNRLISWVFPIGAIIVGLYFITGDQQINRLGTS